MPRPIDVSLGNDSFTIDTGALTSDVFAQFPRGGISLVKEIASAAALPISALASGSLEAGLRIGSPLAWQIGPVSLQWTPNVLGSAVIRKSGEVFRFTQAENDDDETKRQTVVVPDGKAYVSLSFRVNIDVGGGAGFSSGTIGVRASAESTDTFLLANHCRVDASTTVRDAFEQAFQRFLLPFSDGLYAEIADGDFLEYEFYGKLASSVEASLGFSGVLFGGMSGGELRRSISSQVGSLTAGVRPQLDLSAALSVNYSHEDAFRIVLAGMSTMSRLFLFKMDQSLISTGLQAAAGVTLNASIDLELQVNDLVAKAANRLFAGIPDESTRQRLIDQFTKKVQGSKESLDLYIHEAEQRIADQIEKLNRLKVSASATFERISKHACLLSVDFDRNAPPAGFRRAMQGDLVGALSETGVSPAPGSYTRAEIRRTTSLSFQLFDTFRASSMESYFEESKLVYAGNGVLQLRFTTGLTAENNVFGRRKAIEFYFEISADAAASGAVSDQDLRLRINTTDERNSHALQRTAALLHLILRNTSFEGLDNFLNQAIHANPALIVNLSVVFMPSAYRALPFTPFIGDKPAATQTADALNYEAFVEAVDRIYEGAGFGTQGFPDQVARFRNWARYNVTAVSGSESGKPPNRRQKGNPNTDSSWPQDSSDFPASRADRGSRPMLRTFMVAAQQFMNFCEDFPQMARNLDEAATQQALQRVLEQAKDLVHEGAGTFPLFFTKPFVAALVLRSPGTIRDVQAPNAMSARDTLNIQVTVA